MTPRTPVVERCDYSNLTAGGHAPELRVITSPRLLLLQRTVGAQRHHVCMWGTRCWRSDTLTELSVSMKSSCGVVRDLALGAELRLAAIGMSAGTQEQLR